MKTTAVRINVFITFDVLTRTPAARRTGGTLTIRAAGRRRPRYRARHRDGDAQAEAATEDLPITAWVTNTGVRSQQPRGNLNNCCTRTTRADRIIVHPRPRRRWVKHRRRNGLKRMCPRTHTLLLRRIPASSHCHLSITQHTRRC